MADTSPASLDPATMTAIAALAVSIVNWLANRDTKRQAIAADREITALKSSLTSTEDRLRNSLAKELAADESALRVAGELELRLLTQASESTVQAVRALVDALATSSAVHSSIENDKPHDLSATNVAAVTLMHTGVFLPPELDDAYQEAMVVIGRSMSNLADLRALAKVERKERVEALRSDVTVAVLTFRAEAQKWKAEAWQRMRNPKWSLATPGKDGAK